MLHWFFSQGCLLFFSEISYSNNSRKLMNWTAALWVVLFSNSESHSFRCQQNSSCIQVKFLMLCVSLPLQMKISFGYLGNSRCYLITTFFRLVSHACKNRSGGNLIPLQGFRISLFKGMWSTCGSREGFLYHHHLPSHPVAQENDSVFTTPLKSQIN